MTNVVVRCTLFLVGVRFLASPACALDEGILTPTAGTSVSQEEQEFQGAMGVWFKHDYKNGEKMLRKFVKEHPDSRWAAEAELHVGCNLVYQKKYSEAKPIFEKMVAKHPDSNIALKAQIRLGNIAEETGDYKGAMQHFSQVLAGGWTPNEFRYANYRIGKLAMLQGAKQAMIKCGPVALASCLQALGKEAEAAKAKELNPGENGLSLAVLQSEAQALGVKAIPVQMSLDDLKAAKLPVLAFLKPNHFVAVLTLNKDKVQLEDSIQGKHELTLKGLESRWDGKALIFDTSGDLKPLAVKEAEQAVGGCCGAPPEDVCYPCCSCPGQTCVGPGSGGGGGGWGDQSPGNGGSGPGCTYCSSPGRPTWSVNTVNMNLVVQDTPIWYDPGRGPKIAFNLNYNNYGSNTGIFGPGWRCLYDMRVYFLPTSTQAQTTTSQDITPSSPDNGDPLNVASTGNFPVSGMILVSSGGNSEVMAYSSTESGAFKGITRGPNPISALSGSGVEQHTPTLQVHRDNGRIETYEWSNDRYRPSGTFSSPAEEWGYRDTVEMSLDGRVTLYLQGGGKYVFNAEGRVEEIWDNVGNHVTCGYTGGSLTSVTDANGRDTIITSSGSDLDERVQTITLPDNRHADFDYDENGFLNKIVDMGGFQSDLVYGAEVYGAPSLKLAEAIDADKPDDGECLKVTSGPPWGSTIGYPRYGAVEVVSGTDMEIIQYKARGRISVGESFADITRGTPRITAGTNADVTMPFTELDQDVTLSIPENDDDLLVVNTEGFPENGAIIVKGSEVMRYRGKTDTTLRNITRGERALAASGSTVAVIPTMPYLSRIVTPSGQVDFEYHWFLELPEGGYYGLEKAFEYGPGESRPPVPTWYFQHTAGSGSIDAHVTHYPASIGVNGATGGLTKVYYASVAGQMTTRIQEENGNEISYVDDGYKNIQNMTNGAQLQLPSAERRITHFTYDNDPYSHNDDMLTKTDPVQYDLNPLNPTTTYTYENHRVKTVTDASDRLVYQYTYNGNGQITDIKTIDPTTGQPVTLTHNEYDDADHDYRLLSSTDGRGKVANYHYDEEGEDRGFLTSVHVEGQTNPTKYTYDDQGRKETVTDPALRTTTYEYDLLDRVTKTTYPDDSFVSYVYNCCKLDSKTDENNRTTTYHYDSKKRLDWIQDTGGGVTTYVYDSQFLDRVIMVQDPKQTAQGTQYFTQYEYYTSGLGNGKLKKITYADGTWEEYEYNVFGEMTRKTDSEGRRIDYFYDKNGRLIRICPL